MLEAVAESPGTSELDAPGLQGRLPRFGVLVSGSQLMLPERIVCDYVLRSQLFSLPRAPQRMLGLVHSRGYGIPVFDAARIVDHQSIRSIHTAVLIVGQGTSAGGLLVDEPPALLTDVESAGDALMDSPLNPARSDHPVFAGLAMRAFRARLAETNSELDAKGNALDVSVWWQVDFNALFLRLSQMKGSF